MKRVLVVRPSALGDVMRTAPALVAIRAAAPDARIEFLLKEGCEDALAHHPAVDEVVSFPRTRGLALLSWIRQLRSRKYDLVIDVQGLLRSGMITLLTGAPERVGFANAREFGWLGYNRKHHVDASLHHVDRLLGLIEAAGIAPSHDMRLYTGEADQKWLTNESDEAGWGFEPFACLAPTSQWLCKCWPIDRFIELGHRLIDSGAAGGRFAVLYAPDQADYVRPLLEAFENERDEHGAPRLIAPKTTVGQLMALIERSALVVCNDSAVAHAAVGFERPLACVFGPTDPALVGPYRRESSVVRPNGVEGLGSLGFYRKMKDDQTLISKVGVDEVWKCVESQLG